MNIHNSGNVADKGADQLGEGMRIKMTDDWVVISLDRAPGSLCSGMPILYWHTLSLICNKLDPLWTFCTMLSQLYLMPDLANSWRRIRRK